MMLICANCRKFMRNVKGGVTVEEGMGAHGGGVHSHPDEIEPGWTSYKLWKADTYECKACGHRAYAGFALEPFAEHYQPEYGRLRDLGVDAFVADCP